jgi:hypothetical protein
LNIKAHQKWYIFEKCSRIDRGVDDAKGRVVVEIVFEMDGGK